MSQHMQVGSVHIYFEMCDCNEGFEHKIVIKATNYKHTILHGESDLKAAKIQAIEVVTKLGLASPEDAKESLATLC